MNLPHFKKLILAFLFIFSGYNSISQNGELRGFVFDAESGEVVPGANISLYGTDFSTSTDQDGYYAFGLMKAGTYLIKVTMVYYESDSTEINIINGKVAKQNFTLKKKFATISGSAKVFGNSSRKKHEIQISNTTITSRDLNKLPTVGGEPDLLQYLQVLPGAVFSGDQGGQLYIRGGSPIMNKVMLDGITLYNPFHSIGLFSVYDADLIKTADVYSAGFNSEYGGRMSAVIDVNTRDGNKKQLSGKISSNTFTSKLMLEGPIKKYVKGESNSSFVFSYKTSYLEQSAKLFYRYADPSRLPYTFNDIFGKVSMNGANGSYLKLYGFHFDDNVNFKNTTQYHWKNTGVGGRFLVVPEESRTRIDGVFSFSNYLIKQLESDMKPRQSGVNGFNFGMNFRYSIKTDELKYGVEMNGFKTNFEIYNSNGRRIEQFENTTELNFYTYYRFIRKNWLAQFGVRQQFYASLGDKSFEPRFSAKYFVTDRLQFKVAAGRYSQNLLSAFSDRDVVNLFYGFLSGPDDLPETFNGKTVKHHLQKANHLVAGIEWEPMGTHNIQAEIYIKDFTQITNINRDKLFENDPSNFDKPARLREDYIIETGKSWGADFKYKLDLGKWYFWAVYSLNYVTRFDGINTYNTNFDRRHNMNLVGNVELGKKRTAEMGLRFNFGSGFPFTQTQGYYEKFDFGQGISSNYTTDNGKLGIIYGPLNQGRLPYYHRLDFTSQKRITFKNGNKLTLTFSVINIYNRKNIFYFDRFKFVRVDQLPVLPSFGANYTF